MPKHFQHLHPAHMKIVRELVEQNGRHGAERILGLKSGGLRAALSGKGVWPSTIALVGAYVAREHPAPTAPARDLNKTANAFKELGAATALVLEALSMVEPQNRIRVLDMARAAL